MPFVYQADNAVNEADIERQQGRQHDERAEGLKILIDEEIRAQQLVPVEVIAETIETKKRAGRQRDPQDVRRGILPAQQRQHEKQQADQHQKKIVNANFPVKDGVFDNRILHACITLAKKMCANAAPICVAMYAIRRYAAADSKSFI